MVVQAVGASGLIALPGLNGSNGFNFSEATGSILSVRGAGDIDGDGWLTC